MSLTQFWSKFVSLCRQLQSSISFLSYLYVYAKEISFIWIRDRIHCYLLTCRHWLPIILTCEKQLVVLMCFMSLQDWCRFAIKHYTHTHTHIYIYICMYPCSGLWLYFGSCSCNLVHKIGMTCHRKLVSFNVQTSNCTWYSYFSTTPAILFLYIYVLLCVTVVNLI